MVLDYCAAVRGILNDDQGGPLHPPGVRMAEALHEVQESIQRNLGADSLQRWLQAEGWPATRIASRSGYRVLQVTPR